MSEGSYIDQLFGIAGKTAIVTGAGIGGLGEQIAMALANAGVRVGVIDLQSHTEELSELFDKLPPVKGGHVMGFCDVREQVEVDRTFGELASKLGSINILVNVAGVMIRKATMDMSLEEWQRVIDINLTGTWITNKAAARFMLPANSGRIVNFSSLYTDIVGPLPEAPYYASKGGVAQVTRALAGEWGISGINVNCIAPGVFFPTAMTAPLKQQEEVLNRMRERTMLKRLGVPAEDLAGVVLFLCSNASSYMTGQVIYVDGGWTAC